jgi:hypothetical protein
MPRRFNQGMKRLPRNARFAMPPQRWYSGARTLVPHPQHEAPMAARTRPAADAPKRTPSFACAVPLQVTRPQERILLARLEAARQVYHACLGQARIRARLVRESNACQRLPTPANACQRLPTPANALGRCPARMRSGNGSLPRLGASTLFRRMGCMPRRSRSDSPGWESIWRA